MAGRQSAVAVERPVARQPVGVQHDQQPLALARVDEFLDPAGGVAGDAVHGYETPHAAARYSEPGNIADAAEGDAAGGKIDHGDAHGGAPGGAQPGMDF